jgi:chemotaxis protein MotA
VDLATVVGLLAGFAALVIGIIWSQGGLMQFSSVSSVFITIVGSFCALMVANPLSRVLGLMRYFRLALRVPNYEEERIISQLVTFSEKARREGLLALEDDLEEVEDEFLRKGIQLVVDGTDPEIIKNILYNELNQITSRHQAGINIFNDWASLAPAFGMIGTLIGLIIMLSRIEDKSAIGIGMSTALITTLYGAILAYLVFNPIKRKLEDRDNAETLVKEIMIEGILSIQSGDNPRILEEKLLCFLPPVRREAVRQEAARE